MAEINGLWVFCFLWGFFWEGGCWGFFKRNLNGFSRKFGDSPCSHLKNMELGKEGSKPTQITKKSVFIDQTRRDNSNHRFQLPI